MFIATLIAKERLAGGDISAAEDALAQIGAHIVTRSWVDEDVACDIIFSGPRKEAREVLEGLVPQADVVVQAESERRRKLLVADMDSTMITVECIDELADYAGIKEHIAAVTERAMRGEIAFEAALRERVKLLEGMDEAVIDRCRDERVVLMPGARTLVRTMRADGAHCLLVSGGFTRFADQVGKEIGFDRVIANKLGISGGKLDGTVGAPIVGATSKRQALLDTAAEFGLELSHTMAVGDGANDVPMLDAAGLGIAYRAKPAAAAAADARIDHADLTALLYAQGYSRAEWVQD